jgi:hypothetical protein
MEKLNNIIKEEITRLVEYRDNNFKETLLKCAYTLKDLHNNLINQGALKNDYTLVWLDKIIRDITNLSNAVNDENTDWKRKDTVRY